MSNYSILVLMAALASLMGCEEREFSGTLRNQPAQQAEDYATCKKAGMESYRTIYGEIKCTPPQGSNP